MSQQKPESKIPSKFKDNGSTPFSGKKEQHSSSPSSSPPMHTPNGELNVGPPTPLVEIYRDQIKRLTEELNKSSNKERDLELLIKGFEKERKCFKENEEKLKLEVSDLKALVERFRAQKTQDTIKELQEDNTKLKQDLTEALSDAKESRKQATKAEETIRAGLESCSEDFRRLESQLQEQADALRRTEVQLTEKENALSRTEAQLAEKTNALNRAEAQLAEKTNALSRTEVQLTEKANALSRTEAQLAEKTNALSRTETQLAEQTNESQILREQLDDRTQQMLIINEQAERSYQERYIDGYSQRLGEDLAMLTRCQRQVLRARAAQALAEQWRDDAVEALNEEMTANMALADAAGGVNEAQGQNRRQQSQVLMSLLEERRQVPQAITVNQVFVSQTSDQAAVNINING